ncbi:GNAT family N-acetyltransferase [Microvirga solisilvae]|uniref:GNAT family N-acetyltransferase n=1 Tax=Microvirga solisilvae TaxID=2919498 RepID=UPI001FAFDDBD|nr:GNAT family N-acetyltransferase [Microvirga solisilvae]
MSLPAGIVSLPALAYTTDDLAAIMTACFEGYVVPMTMSGEAFNGRFRRENLDLQASRVFVEGERPVAIVLVVRRGWTARIGAMGIVTDFRSKGLGRSALQSVMDDLRKLGDRRLMLEVIDTNEPAVRLYKSLGFKIRRSLVGYRRPAGPGEGAESASLVEVDPLTVARAVASEGAPDLPWFMAPETLAACTAPARGLALGNEAFAIVEPAPQPNLLSLRTLVVARHARGRGMGRRMIASIAAAHPEQDLVISANFPEELATGFIARMGFTKTPISQFEMDLNLSA